MSSLPFRVIPRLDIKGARVVKGRQMEGLRIVGHPIEMAERYAHDGADELLYLDVVSSLYGQSMMHDILKEASRSVFIPLTAGGGVRNVNDIEDLLRCGADKVAINTAAIARPEFITDAAERFGSQAIVLSIDAKMDVGMGDYRCYAQGGREPTVRFVEEWIDEAVSRGAGEILVTSVDRDGTGGGLLPDLVALAGMQCQGAPLIVGGGYWPGRQENLVAAYAEGVAVGAALHGGLVTIRDIKAALAEMGVPVRQEGT